MAVFEKQTLESTKYADLVKLAKEHDVYRRYAPKAELVEKLMALCEPPIETLNDVSMPSFMENDDSGTEETIEDTENSLPQCDSNDLSSHPQVQQIPSKQSKVVSFSPRPPLTDKGKIANSGLNSSHNEPSASKGTPAMRRSLAGPAKLSAPKSKLQDNSDLQSKSRPTPRSSSRRLTRQQTFDVDNSEIKSKSNNIRRGDTFDVTQDSTNDTVKEVTTSIIPRKMKRDATFEVKDVPKKSSTRTSRHESTFELEEVNINLEKEVPRPLRPQKLRREGTFEVEDAEANKNEDSQNSGLRKLRREGTFEVGSTSTSKLPSLVKNKTNPTSRAKATANHLPETRKSIRASLQTPTQSKRKSVATPCSVRTTGQSVPHRFVLSRTRPMNFVSPGVNTSGTKSKNPSLMDEIQKKKAEVSVKKIAGATGEKSVITKKVPDFHAIHKRLFDKMESLVDSRQKVIDIASSRQKNNVKSGKKSPPKGKVVRKLLSPKVGKSKLTSPKPAFQKSTSAYASNIVAIQKRPSVGVSMPGVSKLKSPRFVAESKSQGPAAPNKFGFTKAEPARKDVLKASVMGRKPMKRNSPMSKAKQALQTVRLNKRFELQMKHRLAQQAN